MKVTVTIFPTDGTLIHNPDKAVATVRNVFLVLPCGARFTTGYWSDYDGRGKGSWSPQNRLQATFIAYPRFPHSSVRFDCLPHFKEQDVSFVQTVGQYQVKVECSHQVAEHLL